ncbi:hypothetical protein APHAL10511_004386 [Amanita phalloides]|nr:hypothetical protein APHAL10511_004386 [Amanita phalloides]
MATKLYETLGVSKDVSLEEIRKAYKRKALQTHPDRLPQGSTAEDKAVSEENFRLVNNAYEILSDPQKRMAYDKHGVFPPPEPQRDHVRPSYDRGAHHHSRSHPFGDPFMSHGFSSFVFTDPFALFDEIFGQEFPEWRHHHSRFHGHSRFTDFSPFLSPFSNPLNRSPMGIGGLFANMERDLFGMPGGFPSRSLMSSRAFPALDPPSRNRRERGLVQESYMTQTINGVTQSVHKKVDMDGNEHVTRSFPDGRKVYTVNGVEQPVHGYLPSSEPKDSRRLLSHRDARVSSSQPQPIPIVRSEYSTPPPQYPSYDYNTHPPTGSRRRDHRSLNERHVVDDVHNDADYRMRDTRHGRWPGWR